MTNAELAAFRKAKAAGARDFDHLSTSDKWAAGDDLVLGCFSARDWYEACGNDDLPPKGWRTGFGEAYETWSMSIHG